MDNAVCPRPRVSVMKTRRAAALVDAAHGDDDEPEQDRDRGHDKTRSTPVDQAADAEGEQRADQRGDEVDLRVRDPADREVGEQRLGDEAKALRPARQRADHGQRRDADDDPAVVEAPRRQDQPGTRRANRRSAVDHRLRTHDDEYGRDRGRAEHAHPAVREDHRAVQKHEPHEAADAPRQPRRSRGIAFGRTPPPDRVSGPRQRETRS